MKNTVVSQEEWLSLSAYSQLPARMRGQFGQEWEDKKEDVFGVRDRLTAIEQVFKGKYLGRIVDLGGNSGFYSISLVDSGIASSATVYDVEKRALDVGRRMASALDLQEKVLFKEQMISLDYVDSMESCDCIICLNLIHHAGVLFDVDAVDSLGWGEYSRRWLLAMRQKGRILIMGVGFKGNKPINWNVSRFMRPSRFYQIAESAGWSVIYDANVFHIRSNGVTRANGILTRGSRVRVLFCDVLDRVRVKLLRRDKNLRKLMKSSKYHLYIMRS